MGTENDILARARKLITEKCYPEARTLLQHIPDHSTARQWLAKLDEIAPPASPANQTEADQHIKQTLSEASQLIKQKRYIEARVLLQQIPDHPTARQWLAKLDEIAPGVLPPPPPPPLSDPAPSPSARPTEEPVDPAKIAMWQIYFTPIMMWKYTKNWARLGKPEWGTTTGWAGLLLFAWIIAGLIALVVDIESILSLGLLISGALTNLAFWIIIGHLQQGAYKTWTATRDWDALRAHPYRVDNVIRIVIGICVILIVVFTGLLWSETQAPTYENDYLSLTYDRDFKTFDTSDYGVCEDYNYGCFLGLFDQWGDATLVFAKMDIDQDTKTSVDAENYLWDYWSYYSAETINYEEMTIGGLPAVFREFGLLEDEDDPYYHMMVFVVVNGNDRYDITVWDVGEGSLDRKRDMIMDIINSIEFK